MKNGNKTLILGVFNAMVFSALSFSALKEFYMEYFCAFIFIFLALWFQLLDLDPIFIDGTLVAT